MKKLIALCLLLATILSIFLYLSNKPKENYAGEEIASWEKGLTFKVTEVIEQDNYYDGNVVHFPKGKFIVVAVEIANNSDDSFNSFASNVWLSYKGSTKIEQSDLTYNRNTNWHNIEIVPTLCETKKAVFDVGKEVDIADLEIVISNTSVLRKKVTKIKLTERPTTYKGD